MENTQIVNAVDIIENNNQATQTMYVNPTTRLLDAILATNNTMTEATPVNNLTGMNM